MIGNIIQELQNEKVVFDQLTINYFEKAINSCAVFLTLNYDLVLEELLLSTRSSNNFLMKSFYPIPLTSAFARGGAGGWYASRAENQPYIYKLHGSINWYYSGMQSFYGEQIYFADIGDKSKKVERDMDYELIEDKVPLIIPPTFSKSHYFNSETIKLMWKKAESEIKKAKRLICIGYSFPTSDTVLKQLIQSSLSDDCEVIIVNPDKNVSFRIREVLGKNRIFQFDDHPHISFFKKELASDS